MSRFSCYQVCYIFSSFMSNKETVVRLTPKYFLHSRNRFFLHRVILTNRFIITLYSVRNSRFTSTFHRFFITRGLFLLSVYSYNIDLKRISKKKPVSTILYFMTVGNLQNLYFYFFLHLPSNYLYFR